MVWTVENGKAVFQEYTDTEAFANTSIAAASSNMDNREQQNTFLMPGGVWPFQSGPTTR